MVPYADCKIYGPYTCADGRKRLHIIRQDGSKTSVSYPKYLKELSLGRYLDKHETVDHDNQNFRDDSLDNLKVLPKPLHMQLDAKRLVATKFTCPTCGIEFELEGKRLSKLFRNRTQRPSQTGPYCSKQCAGTRIGRQTPAERKYTTLKQRLGTP